MANGGGRMRRLAWGKRSVLLLGAAIVVATAAAEEPAELQQAAPPRSRNEVLLELAKYSRRPQFHVGQNLGHSSHAPDVGFRAYVAELARRSGRWPSIVAADYGYNRLGVGVGITNECLIRHWREGGMVSISAHFRNPWRNSDCHDVRSGDLDVLLVPGSAVHRRWRGMLDQVADGLTELRDAGVVVLWRPFHEMNGAWFWWSWHRGQRISPTEFCRLWRDMHHYLTEERKLTNLLWVYAPSAVYSARERPVLDYYPGDDVVDVVALDFYGAPGSGLLEAGLVDLATTGKPVGVAEFSFGTDLDYSGDNMRLVRAIQNFSTSPAFVVYWHSWDNRNVAIVDHLHADSLMRHSDVVTRPVRPR